MQKLIRFIKYNNAFTIIIALIFFSAGGAFANEKVRDTVIGQTIVTKKGTDNTQIISANLDNFNMGLRIKSVKEDDKFYYVNFDYKTIDAIDGVWKETIKEKNISVSKAGLKDMDLGLYLAEELSQLTAKEMAYMKEVQDIEKNKGAQKQTESTEYTGLKGLVLNNETKELAGYRPVKEEKEDKTIVINAAALVAKVVADNEQNDSVGALADAEKIGPQVTVVKEVLSKETIMKMVKEALAKEKGITLSTASTTDDALSSASSTEVSSSSSSSAPTFVSDEVGAPTGSVGAVSGGGGETAQSSSNSSASSSSESSSSSTSSSLPTGQAGSESSSVTASSSSEVSSSSSEAASSSVSSSSESSSSSSESASSSISSSESSSSSASETSSSSSSAESQPSLEATAGQASSSVSETSSSSSETSVSSSSESSASSV